jgi:predicted outer membrane repeat protein
MCARQKILRLFLFSLVTISLVLAYGLALGAVWRVDGQNGIDSTDCSRGTSWARAFKTIQKAIDCAATGDAIWVKKGNYEITSPIEVNKEVAIYGGFSGIEKELTQRDWKTNTTTVDGRNLVRCFTVTATTTIDGFTITRGYSTGDGGAIYADLETVLSTTNCIFTYNKAGRLGGAIHCVNLVFVQDCFFSDNEASSSGGAISTSGYAEVKADRCTFVRNRAESGGAISGGGEESEATNSIFAGNTATRCSAIDGFFRWFYVGHCTFIGNYASDSAVCRLPEAFHTRSKVGGSIFWDNRSQTGDVFLLPTPAVYGTDIQGGHPDPGSGNINSDPRLVNPGFWLDKNNTPDNSLDDVYVVGGDFHLKPDSPCIPGNMGAVPYAPCALNAKFQQADLVQGMTYYTDRTYTLTSVPSKYLGLDMIKTPNDDRASTDTSGYLKFEMPDNGTVYVAYDRRATSLPNWMSGFTNTGDTISTSMSTQGYFRVYRKAYGAGSCVDLGGNYAPGSSTEYRSNYIVFYNPTTAACTLAPRFQKTTLTQGMTYYADRSYTLTSVPSEYLGLDTIKTPNDDRYRTDASGYLTFTMPWRATSLPTWMSGFTNTGDTITTSLSTQGYLKVYKMSYTAETCVDLGGNEAAGSSTEERSNYIVFYRAAAPPPKEVIVDNGDSGTSSTGTWLLSGGEGSYGTQSVYSKSGSTYTFSASVTGPHDVYMWWTWYASRCTSVRVEIYNGATLLGTVYVNQQVSAKGASWNKLGSYQFDGHAKVVIQATSSSCSTCADAVKFLSTPP